LFVFLLLPLPLFLHGLGLLLFLPLFLHAAHVLIDSAQKLVKPVLGSRLLHSLLLHHHLFRNLFWRFLRRSVFLLLRLRGNGSPLGFNCAKRLLYECLLLDRVDAAPFRENYLVYLVSRRRRVFLENCRTQLIGKVLENYGKHRILLGQQLRLQHILLSDACLLLVFPQLLCLPFLLAQKLSLGLRLPPVSFLGLPSPIQQRNPVELVTADGQIKRK